jgi:hypothetical protein
MNTSDLLPILTSALITDMIVILLSITGIIKSKALKEWYNKYNLSAVLCDVLIIVIGIIITRYVYPYVFSEYSLSKFILLAVVIQIIHDILFYILFTNIPRHMNSMIDTFKDYANEVSYKAILSDSGMVISTCIIASLLASKSYNTNIIILIVSIYLLPYLIYT